MISKTLIMKINTIQDNQVQIFNGELKHDPDKGNTHLIILIMDEYVKSKNYQNLMRENKQFSGRREHSISVINNPF